jgi:hypothetical protein
MGLLNASNFQYIIPSSHTVGINIIYYITQNNSSSNTMKAHAHNVSMRHKQKFKATW